ncbi:N-acetyl-gamma-glutamyl-phosphate reductase [Rosistilla carotiformis]|uniref:N-acetyl-gamma-glutamyl-phosphate reductase n=1 Tax=Rosistilla carotiformis TaxID=2528017 RepID=A0A518JTD4_9BACT|nr:N-acetyl-gamma-glutamyl-phosphate reductase [Rosistilla carotiformis]QDV68800.1 N-acetyl-gamma-glutamyl-phosphate reductase [Rosistilla carotiformis]
MKVRVGIIGATGYTAYEAIRLLLRHPHAEVTAVTSRQDEGLPIAAVHPQLTRLLDLKLEPLEVDSFAERCDVAFCCLPHGASAETVKQLREVNCKVIDFSADFRLSRVAEYETWYGVQHPWPELVGQVAYGLPELFADQIKDADLIANPGCYPTSAIMPLAPLLKAGAIQSGDIIVDSKSGVSGAGRTPKLGTLYCEANESIAPYAIGAHRHQPEMNDIIHRFSGSSTDILFTPHLTPMDRGILSTIYVRPNGVDADAVREIWQSAYRDSPFVRIVDHIPSTKHVAGTNFVDLAVRTAGNRLVVVAAIDNLIKGASGAAVQNLNCIYGWDQTLGLL